MNQITIFQKEINLLVKQAILVTALEAEHLYCITEIYKNNILVKKSEPDKSDIIRQKLNEIYPSYLELRNKYLTHE